MIRWALKLSEFNIEWEHRPGVQNVVADLLSRNPVDSIEGSQISCAALRALAINSREQFIREQREDPELGHIYRYLENPDDGSVNATVCEGWSLDFKLINGLLFYAKYFSSLGELRVYIPGSLRKDIMKEFHDLPLAGHLGKRKTYLKLRDTCYFPFMRKYILEYVSTCDRCQKFNYKNALPVGRLMPIVSKYPNEIVTLDLLGPYPTSQPKRYKFILVISDHFTKWCELIPLRKASAQAIANALFDNYIARYGAPISLISDKGPQFISDVFEHLSHRLDIKHMKTVTYRLQAYLTERANRNLVQMIASFVEENHENWDQFLYECAFALCTALINVTEDTKYVGRNIERLFDEARRNMRKKHKSREKYYNRRRRDVHIKVNDLVLIQTHFLSAAGRKQVRVYRPGQTDTISSDSQVETLYDEQGVSHRSNIYIDRIKGSLKSTGKPLVRKVRGVDHGRGYKSSTVRQSEGHILLPDHTQQTVKHLSEEMFWVFFHKKWRWTGNSVPLKDTRNSAKCIETLRSRIVQFMVTFDGTLLRAVGSLVVRASDSRPEGLGSMPPNTLRIVTCIAALHGGSLVVLGSNSSYACHDPNTLTTGLPQPVHTEYVLVKSVGPKVLWSEITSAGDWRIFSSPTVPCLNCGGGDWWCVSRPTTGVHLALCHDEFSEP
ncbi:retrovirus-related Pol polyprotein from transposon 412 [Trichonephila clavipes]|nr:retrovirus-related Pol polyprotein from transposon 412 [Trichonephila clavipes]